MTGHRIPADDSAPESVPPLPPLPGTSPCPGCESLHRQCSELAGELGAARAGNAGYRERLAQAGGELADSETARRHYFDGMVTAGRQRDEARARIESLAADLDYARRGALAAIEKRDEARGERGTAREERRSAEDERDRLRARLTGISVIFRGAILTEELERAPGDAATEELRRVAAILWGQAEAPEAKP